MGKSVCVSVREREREREMREMREREREHFTSIHLTNTKASQIIPLHHTILASVNLVVNELTAHFYVVLVGLEVTAVTRSRDSQVLAAIFKLDS
jgi:hypothetical protein